MANPRPNQVRIIAGKWRGRKVDFLPSAALRPTGDRIRETAFNWLQSSITGAKCLDLFSGSGVFGFESLSRGAEHVVMVDQDPKVKDKIMTNADSLRVDHSCYQVWVASVPSEQVKEQLRQFQFDIVFVDPPFNQGMVGPTCALLVNSGCLAPGSMVYIEAEQTLDLADVLPESWEIMRAKKTGNVAYYLIATNAKR